MLVAKWNDFMSPSSSAEMMEIDSHAFNIKECKRVPGKEVRTKEYYEIFIIKAIKSISIISAEGDGLIKSFHLATSIFFYYICYPKI